MTQNRPAPTASLGEQLRRYRQRAGLTQADLAERTGLTTVAISALERGTRNHPYPHTTRQLVGALGLSDEERAAFIAAASRAAPKQSVEPSAHPAHAGVPASTPIPPTPLIGRALELARLRARIDRPAAGRLTTITGLAGIGKTRLVLQLAAELRPEFPDGVWFVALAPISDPAEVPRAVAAELGVREVPDEPLVERLIAFLAPRHALLILDNCEHVLDSCATLLGQFLVACPDLQMIATSREPTNIGGEHIRRLGPLSVPTQDGTTSAEQLAEIAAVQLFVERAQAAAAHFQLTDTNAHAVADICMRLEGIPLAIELAAGWVRVIKVEQIAERLADALAAPVGRKHGMPGRQQTLSGALDWSYTLLGASERRLFERLAVFRGGASLEAVETICSSDDLPRQAILGLIAQLVDKSLVLMEDDGPVARYRLLEPVRLFAADRLHASGETERVASRHATAFLVLAERAAPELRGPAQVDWLQRLDREQDNFRIALRWMVDQSHATDGLRLAVALAPFWSGHGHLSEGRRWLALMLELPGVDTTSPELRVSALSRAGEFAQWQGELGSAERLLDESITLAEAINDDRGVADATTWISLVRRRQLRFPKAMSAAQKALTLARKICDRPVEAFALLNLGVTAAYMGDIRMAHELLDECRSLYRELGDVRFIAIACTMLGETERILGNDSQAATLLREGLIGHMVVGDRASIDMSLRRIATLALPTRPDVTARLLGVANALRDTLGSGQAPSHRLDDDDLLLGVQEQLSVEDIEASLAVGRALTLDEAIKEALEMTATIASTPATTPPH